MAGLGKKIIFIGISLLMVSCGTGEGDITIIPSTDTFTQEGSEVVAKMDILWVIDNSGSMADFQQALADNFNAFIADFATQNYDFKMAVITTDAWADPFSSNVIYDSDFKETTAGNRVLTADTPNLEAEFIELALQGTAGAGDERPFQSVREALEDPDNAGFHREDAHLAIIIVSDEEDFSNEGSSTYLGYTCVPAYNVDNSINTSCFNYWTESNPQPGTGEFLTPVSFYSDYLDTFSNDTYDYSVYSMAILDHTCRQSDATFVRLLGNRLTELSDISGGITSSLCGNFSEELDAIAQTIIERTVEFFLESVPANPNFLIVEAKAPGASGFSQIPQSETDGWIYGAVNNSIIFSGSAVPAQGAEIRISYDPDSL